MTAPPLTLREAQDWLRQNIDDGAICPCCTKFAKVYRWSLYGTAAQALILFHRLGGTESFIHSRDLKRLGYTGQGDASRLKYWDLVVEEKQRREDGGRSGYWRVTGRGRDFIFGVATLPKYSYIYDDRLLRQDGPMVSIIDVLGKRFDYRELMAG